MVTERPVIDLLAQLQVHPVLFYLTLDGITPFVRLITRLKHDILQPQPVNETTPSTAPFVLPNYAWEMPMMPLMQED